MRKIAPALCLLICALLLFGALPKTASAEADSGIVKVKLSAPTGNFSVALSGKYYIKETNFSFDGGELKLTVSGSEIHAWHTEKGLVFAGASFTLNRYSLEPENMRAKIGGRNYLGNFVISLKDGAIRVVNHVPLNQYLYGVVGAEMSDGFPLEALKAQAVIAKNYLLCGISERDGYHIGDTSADQAYKGYDPDSKNVIQAVDAVMSKALTVDSKLVNTYYSASNGGETTLATYAWSGRGDAGLAVALDEYDIKNPSSRENKIFIPYSGTKDMEPRLAEMLLYKASMKLGEEVSEITKISGATTHQPTRPDLRRDMIKCTLDMTVACASGTKQMELTFNLIDLFSYGIVPSTTLRIYWGEEAENGFNIYNVRYGHGVGLSQRGAQERAKDGHTYKQILKFYYPKAALTDISIKTPANPKPPHEPVSGSAYNAEATANTSMYTGPGESYANMRAVSSGEAFKVLGEKDGYAYAEYLGINGFIKLTSLKKSEKTPSNPPYKYGSLNPPDSTPLPSVWEFGRVNAEGVNFRTGPGEDYPALKKLSLNQELEVGSLNNSTWYYVRIGQETGYVFNTYITLMPMPQSTGTIETGIVRGNSSLRQTASAESPIITALSDGDYITVYSKEGTWYLAGANGAYGYINSARVDIIARMPDSNIVPWGETNSNANLRADASRLSALVKALGKGEVLTLLQQKNGWFKVRAGSGEEGYISSSYVQVVLPLTDQTEGGEENALYEATLTRSVSMLADPRRQGRIIGSLSKYAAVSVLSEQGGFVKIRANNYIGYIPKDAAKKVG